MPETIRRLWNTTHWSLIFAAGKDCQSEALEALDVLLQIYRNPCLRHLERRFSISEETAEDWFHDFVEKKILAKDLLKKADPSRGRFRDLLRTGLTRFGIDQLKRASRWEVVEDPHALSLDDPAAHVESADDPFSSDWVRTLLFEAAERTRKHYAEKERLSHWNVYEEGFLRPHLHESKAPSRRDLSIAHHFHCESKVNNVILNVNRYFRQTLFRLLADYCHSNERIQEEWHWIQRHCFKR